MTIAERFHKGDRIVTTAPVFAVGAQGLIPAGTTGVVIRGGRWGAEVKFDHPDLYGNPTTRAAILPRPTERIQKAEGETWREDRAARLAD